MNVGKKLGLALVAAVMIGAPPSRANGEERIVLGEYFTNLY